MNRDQAQELLPIITAFAGGKSVQWRHVTSERWRDTFDPNFALKDFEWRIKPMEFPKLPDGLEWHNPAGIPAEKFGDDWRPLVVGEVIPRGYQFWDSYKKMWCSDGVQAGCSIPDCNFNTTCRVPISTPFPEPTKPKVMVPLEPSDISPTDVLRQKPIKYPFQEHWMKIDAVNSDGPAVHFAGYGRTRIPFKTLMNEWEISRDGAKTWNPCEKESES